ncbi:uncharacterized protein [Rutidosis leptorrhynchoides]|uniref:uncharacterized protein n=1 Tax=Rutidosis leptorrhynchoides TaxID=125765 RepID=UPI003A9942ED
MKIISYNIRGFGSGKLSKFGETKKIILKEKPSFLAIQESKLRVVNETWVKSLWGSDNCNFIQQEMIGKSSGQLLIWDTIEFDATDVIRFDCAIGIRGIWKSNGAILNVLNVYRPHDDSKKQILWDQLLKTVENEDEVWVVCGDFNEVRCDSERFNCVFDANRANRFNNFINSSGLIDIPIGGRLFTRISDDGTKFSKLDRFLVSWKFHSIWGNISAVTLDRTKSDHCPIFLKDAEINYGPKPFKVFDIWFDDKDAGKVVHEAWNTTDYSGTRMDIKFAVKLKGVKAALKSWSKQNFGQIDMEIEILRNETTELELKAESVLLSETELESWREKRKSWLEKETIKSCMLK